MDVKYIGPVSPIDIPALGIGGVKTGDIINVSALDGGKAPSAMVNHKPDTEIPAHHFTEQQIDGSTSSYDPGFGLLAQTGNWISADTKDEAK